MLDKALLLLGLIIFISLFPLLSLDSSATHLIWTLIIPIIPLALMIMGYSRWRRICPLSFLAKLSQNSTFLSKRFAGSWLKEHFYSVQFSLLFVAFSARHWLLNYEALALLMFFIAVGTVAYLTGLLYSGKTWCNYICPVGIVEKIYSHSNANRWGQNSACGMCTACKTNCPDIDLESSYWKEQHLPYKKELFYAFSGLVFGFYFYYYAQTGSWNSYFDGAWTRNSQNFWQIITAPGFFFFPAIPQLLAVPLTLIATSAMSVLFFKALEHSLVKIRTRYSKEPQNISHFVMVFSGFTAFNIFYLFAGAPSYDAFPKLYHGFQLLVVMVSTIWLWRELPREERYYLQERFARKILKKYPQEAQKTGNLKEIYYIYANQQKDHKIHLENYKETLSEFLSDGILTIEEVTLLDKIREQLNITDQEHDKIMRQLKNSDEMSAFEVGKISQEKLYQLRNYQKTLKTMLAQDTAIDERVQEQLRIQFNISKTEHTKIISDLLNNDETVWRNIDSKIAQLTNLATASQSFHPETDKESDYLHFMIKQSISESLNDLQTLMSTLYDNGIVADFIKLLNEADPEKKERFIQCLKTFHPRSYDAFINIYVCLMIKKIEKPAQRIQILHLIINCGYDEMISAALLYIYKKGIYGSEFYINEWIHYSNSTIREIAKVMKGESSATVTEVERLAYLHSVPIFSKLNYSELSALAKETQLLCFEKDSFILTQGEQGDTLFILTEGECRVIVESQGKQQEVARLKQGEVLGEIAIISQTNRTASVQAVDNVECLRLSGTAFKAIIFKNPGVGIDVMQEMTRRLLTQSQLQ